MIQRAIGIFEWRIREFINLRKEIHEATSSDNMHLGGWEEVAWGKTPARYRFVQMTAGVNGLRFLVPIKNNSKSLRFGSRCNTAHPPVVVKQYSSTSFGWHSVVFANSFHSCCIHSNFFIT